MKALVIEAANAPFVMKEIPDPVPGPVEAVVRVLACGSGLTIQHVKAGRAPVAFPRIIGHEITGEVVALGFGAAGLAIDDPVTAYFYLTCGRCKWCRTDRETLCENFAGFVGREVDGGYAEYIKLPASSFLKLPEALDHRRHRAEIGVVTDALATPLKVLRRARIVAGETVAVFGAGGGLGIHMLMMLRWAHARPIAVDIVPGKLAACREAGADEVIDGARNDVSEALVELTGGAGVDVAIDFVSAASTLEAAVAALGRGGRLVTLGGAGQPFRAPSTAMLNKEFELLGSRYATRQEVIEALQIVARGEVWPMVTVTGRLADAEVIHQQIEAGLITGRAAILIE